VIFSTSTMVAILMVVHSALQLPASPVEGAWKRVSESYAAPDTSWTITHSQSSLYLFTKNQYSMMYVIGTRPRILFAGPDSSCTEKIALYDLFRASAGTYEVNGPLLVIHPVVARSPDYMAVKADTAWYQVRGDTLFLTARYRWWRDRAKRVVDSIALVRAR
jgi:hypothetical protein